jgi:hypothetical protein
MTVTYTYPVAGTTPPTAAQMLNANLLSATVNVADGDTIGSITHNWGLSAQEQAWIRPLITTYEVTTGTGSSFRTWTVTNGTTPANAITFGKSGSVGTGGTFQVNLLRPTTLMQ